MRLKTSSQRSVIVNQSSKIIVESLTFPLRPMVKVKQPNVAYFLPINVTQYFQPLFGFDAGK